MLISNSNLDYPNFNVRIESRFQKFPKKQYDRPAGESYSKMCPWCSVKKGKFRKCVKFKILIPNSNH